MTEERLHALDAARAFALLLGIVLHATMSFFFFIPARDVSQSTTLGVTFYVIHIFRMSLFFLIAGFFAHLMFHRRGVRGFIKDRAKRIVVPMTVGWVVLAPPTIAVVAWGLGRTFADGPPAGADAGALLPEGFPLTQLWFLYYLCIFYVLALLLRWAFVSADRTGVIRRGVDGIIRTILPTFAAPLLFAAPLFAVLYFTPTWMVWFGLPSPDTGFAPQLPAMAGFGTAFGLGWLMHRQVDLLGVWRRQWAVNLIVAVALTAWCLTLVGPLPTENVTVIAGPAWHRLAYAGAYTVSIWFWTFGLIGAALRFCSNASPARRYLADASYWFYLVHVPIVFGLQVLMMDWPLSWVIKFPLILGITLGLLLASYHYLVRPTVIGEILNGRKYPRRKRAAMPSAAEPVHAGQGSVAPVARLTAVTKRYGKAIALDGLTLEVRPGELLAVLGPNGAGKTTAIGLWLGTLEPDDGAVSIMGGSPFDVQSRLGVGVMMQEVNLAPMLTGREIVALTATYYRDPLPVDEVLALTGSAPLADRRYGKLSAGQKRQVQFAAAVCGRPALLFLDEPTVGLDVQAREAMWKAIRRLLDQGCSIVLTTHYLEEAEALATRVAVLAKGKLIAEGSVDEMRALVTRKRIGCVSTLDVGEIRVWPGVVDAVRDGKQVQVTAFDAESVVRRLLAADPALSQLEVKQASLAEAFTEITREAA
jgi:ABC-type multidrug transport system ATPase subunit